MSALLSELSPQSANNLVLEEIPRGLYREASDAVQEFLPHSFSIQGTLKIAAEFEFMELYSFKLYTPSTPSLRYKIVVQTPIVTGKDWDSLNIFWSPDHLSEDAVYLLLSTLPPLRPGKPFMIRQIHPSLQPSMTRILEKLSGGSLSRHIDIPSLIYVMGDTLPPSPQLPEGYYMKQLPRSNLIDVINEWNGSYHEDTSKFATTIEQLPTVGIYKKRTKGELKEDELVCYSLMKYWGDVGMTFTRESQRRKGLAKIATLHLFKNIFQKNVNKYILIEEHNVISVKMAENLGFRYYSTDNMVIYIPESFNYFELPSFEDFEKEMNEKKKKLQLQ